jgi:ATP-binding cassette subfamily F protein uup
LYLCTVLIKNPNFLVLDEPTNDLDIVTLNILEEYLANFKGCVIVVSHDRYFMDKVADHLLVFKGQGEIKDFPGNYTQYRASEKAPNPLTGALDTTANQSAKASQNKSNAGSKRPLQGGGGKLSFGEKRELEALEKEIPALEAEQKQLEQELSSGVLSNEDLLQKSQRISQLIAELDEKSMRWLELDAMK